MKNTRIILLLLLYSGQICALPQSLSPMSIDPYKVNNGLYVTCHATPLNISTATISSPSSPMTTRLSAASYTTEVGKYSSPIFSPGSTMPQPVVASSGDMKPFTTFLRKAPPTGNDDDEGDNTDIDAQLSINDGLICLCLLLLLYMVYIDKKLGRIIK